MRVRRPRFGVRFTPTCVGTMTYSERQSFLALGSPPRAWGQCRRRDASRRRAPVHPHVRGDNTTALYAVNGRTSRCRGSTWLTLVSVGHQGNALEVFHLPRGFTFGAEVVPLWAGIGPYLKDITALAFLDSFVPELIPYSGRRTSKENPSLGLDQPTR